MSTAIRTAVHRTIARAATGGNIFVQWQKAYTNFRSFKSLTPHQMQDIGITQDDVDRARLGDFLTAKQP